MRKTLIAAALVLGLNTQLIADDADRSAALLERVGQHTVCLVVNKAFGKDLGIFMTQMGLITESYDQGAVQSNVFDSLKEAETLLVQDRNQLIKQLINLGSDPADIIKYIAQVVQIETAEYDRLREGVIDAKTAARYVALTGAKQAICDRYVKSWQGTKI